MTQARCSDASLAAGETLHATATHATSWLLVEVPGPWPRDVGAEGAVPPGAAEAARGWLERTPSSRLLFLRRPQREGAPLAVFVVRAEEGAGETRRLELASLDDLAAVDFDREGRPFAHPLVLVCGHGSRDACCALRGTAVVGALSSVVPDGALWISSHQGGHRFAANVLVLPAGLHFGRVDPHRAGWLVGRALAGEIELDAYRGRTCYAPEAQAAEHTVRVAGGLERVEDLRLVDAEDGVVRFADSTGDLHSARVESREGPVVPASCGAEPEAQPLLVGRLA